MAIDFACFGDYLFRFARFGRFGCFGGFARFVSLFRALAHATIYGIIRVEIKQTFSVFLKLFILFPGTVHLPYVSGSYNKFFYDHSKNRTDYITLMTNVLKYDHDLRSTEL